MMILAKESRVIIVLHKEGIEGILPNMFSVHMNALPGKVGLMATAVLACIEAGPTLHANTGCDAVMGKQYAVLGESIQHWRLDDPVAHGTQSMKTPIIRVQ